MIPSPSSPSNTDLPEGSAREERSRVQDVPATVLAWTLFLVPAVGVPSELMLQDTLKSALVAFSVLGAALIFFWHQRQRNAPLQWHGLVWLPLLLMGYALGSMAWSHTYLAGVEAIRWFLFALLLWLGLNTLTPHNLPRLMWGIHSGAVVASLWAALQFWLNFGLFPQAAAPASTFINRNFFAEYVVCTVPFSVFLLANLRPTRWLPLVAGSLALNLVALMMTGTRSALVALWVMVPVLVLILVKYRQQFAFLQWSKTSRTATAFVLGAAVLGMGSVPSGNPSVVGDGHGTTALQRSFARTSSMAQPTEYTEGSFSIRSQMWKATARMMLAHPWTGVGAGAWEVQIPLYQNSDTTLETDYYAHNEYLQLLSEYGVVVGGLVMAFLFAYLLVSAGKTWRLHDATITEAPLRALTLASMLALLIVSNAGFPWRLASTGALFALSLATLATSDARLGIRESFFSATLRLRPGYSRIGLGLLVGCTILAIYTTRQAAQAEQKIVQAIKLSFFVAQPTSFGNQAPVDRKKQLLQSVREGIAINPHYRKLTPMVADNLAAAGDWKDAIWIWESVVASRPHVAVLWSNIARGYTQTGQYERAIAALQKTQQLQPDAPGIRALEIVLLSRTGHETKAIEMLVDYFAQARYDNALLQVGYEIGLKTHNWSLAIQSLELRNQTWPEQAAETYFLLGKIYADPEVNDHAKALASFRAALQAAPPKQKNNFRKQVPEKFRASL